MIIDCSHREHNVLTLPQFSGIQVLSPRNLFVNSVLPVLPARGAALEWVKEPLGWGLLQWPSLIGSVFYFCCSISARACSIYVYCSSLFQHWPNNHFCKSHLLHCCCKVAPIYVATLLLNSFFVLAPPVVPGVEQLVVYLLSFSLDHGGNADKQRSAGNFYFLEKSAWDLNFQVLPHKILLKWGQGLVRGHSVNRNVGKWMSLAYCWLIFEVRVWDQRVSREFSGVWHWQKRVCACETVMKWGVLSSSKGL